MHGWLYRTNALKPVSFAAMAMAYDTTFLISQSGKIFQSGKYFRSNQNGPKLEFFVIKNVTFIWKHHHFEQSLLSRAGWCWIFLIVQPDLKSLIQLRFFLSFGQEVWIYKFKLDKKISQNGKKWFHSKKAVQWFWLLQSLPETPQSHKRWNSNSDSKGDGWKFAVKRIFFDGHFKLYTKVNFRKRRHTRTR